MPSLIKNDQFDLERFRMCGGILNSKFWDINLRYAQAVCHMNEEDINALFISNVGKWLMTLDEHDRQFFKTFEKK
jgi:hypothetical protein